MDFQNTTNEKSVILVVDDQPTNLKVMAGVLSEEYTLSIANNGINALKMLEKRIPDLILLDIMMPEMDGYEVCRRLKENEKTKDIPVIFLTAKTEIEDVVKGFEYGAVDYIFKPFHTTEMKVRVRNHLNLFHSKNEIKQMNQKLLEAQEDLKKVNSLLEISNQEKDKFFSIIAHDLKSPFNSILGFSEILKEEINNLDQNAIVEYAGIINYSTRQTLQLLENLLHWARMKQGRMEYLPKNLALSEITEEVLGLVKENARQKNIFLINNVPLETQVFADENMLKTILRNLIVNSIKFTNSGGVVEITSMINNNQIQISVSDTGVGISKQNLEKLFLIGTSFTTRGTDHEKGTGLGLLLCKELVEKHSGRIWAESEINSGTIFHFTVPCLAD